jgi:hypothetical protein
MLSWTIPSSEHVRDSFQGMLIQVSHVLCIEVVPNESCVTHLHTRMDVCVVHHLQEPSSILVAMAMPTSDYSTVHTSYENGGVVVSSVDATALSLPNDWSTQTAELINLPVAKLVGISSGM